MHSLAERVRFLVDTRHRGNVRRAARDSGVPHPTLVRIVNGTVKDPRSETLRTLSRFYGVTIDWLLTGASPGPAEVEWYQGTAESIRWVHLVLGLQLWEQHPDVHAALLELPDAVAQAAFLFDVAALGGQPKRRLKIGKHAVEERMGVAPGFLTAHQRELEGWLAFFEEWIARAGKEAVKTALITHAAAVRSRFVTMPT